MESGEKRPRNARLLAQAFERSTKPLGSGAKPDVPRRTVTFEVDHTVCAPGVFDEDFELTLSALTPGEELAAARACRGDVTSMAMTMARNSVTHVNGTPIDRSVGQDEWLWNVLGSGGRQLVVAMFAFVGVPGEDAMGKAQATLRVT